MIDDLLHDHDRIREISAALRTHLAGDGMPIDPSFASARWRLTRELLRHMAVEKQMLQGCGRSAFDLAPESPHSAAGFERLYREHVARWTTTDIDTQWRRYCRELRTILTLLDQRMHFEERAVFAQAR